MSCPGHDPVEMCDIDPRSFMLWDKKNNQIGEVKSDGDHFLHWPIAGMHGKLLCLCEHVTELGQEVEGTASKHSSRN